MSDDTTRGTGPARQGAASLRQVITNQEHSHPDAGGIEWGAVVAIVLGVALGAAALVLGVVWLAIPAGLLVVGGAVTGLATGIMNRTEDYPSPGT
jgi:hypothetical protein